MLTTKHPNAVIGQAVVDHVNSGAIDDASIWDKHWNPDFVSVESDGQEYAGRDAVAAKCEQWMASMTVHGCTAHGPYVTPNGFCVRYEIDLEAKDGSFPRMQADEIAHYTIKNGKVVREEFFGRPMPG